MTRPARNILLTPGPATTTQGVKDALVVPDICPREEEFGGVVAALRSGLLEVAGADPRTHTAVLVGGPGTAAVEAAIGSAVPKGGRLLIMSNGAYGERAAAIARVLGISHSSWEVPWTKSPSPEEFSARLAGPGGPFTHAFWVHHETTTGLLNPLDAYAEACRSRGVVSIVDAMSSFAGMPLPLGRLPVGYLITSSNKGLQGMAGIGIVFSRLDALEASRGSARSVALDLHAHEAGERAGQFPFTPPVQVAYALLEAVRETLKETVAGRAARYRSCYEAMLGGMEGLGFEALLPRPLHSGLLTAFRTPERPGFSYRALHDHLLGLGVTLYPGKLPGTDTFRVANIGDITPADIRTFLTGVETYTNGL